MGAYAGPDVSESGLVLALDAGNTKSYPGSGTTWTDLSGLGNNGTLTNGPTYISSNGGSIVFDGVNDYIDNTFSFSSRPFSINCWLYFNSLTNWQTFVAQDTSQSTLLGSFYFQKTNNSGDVGVGRTYNTFGISLLNSTNSTVNCYDTTLVTTGIWYNYCVSVSTTNINLYKNGSLVQTTVDSSLLATPTANIKIGAGVYNNALVDYVNGRISQVSIYNRALTVAEIQQNFNATKGRYGL
jgi:hypothetical protein